MRAEELIKVFVDNLDDGIVFIEEVLDNFADPVSYEALKKFSQVNLYHRLLEYLLV